MHAPLYHQHPQTKKKPPLPSPFLTKYEGTASGNSAAPSGVSHSKLALYSQSQV
jgi:hypothetical protein